MGTVIQFKDIIEQRLQKSTDDNFQTLDDLHSYVEDIMVDILELLDGYEFIYDSEDGVMMEEVKLLYFTLISMVYRTYTEKDNEPNEIFEQLKQNKDFEKMFSVDIEVY